MTLLAAACVPASLTSLTAQVRTHTHIVVTHTCSADICAPTLEHTHTHTHERRQRAVRVGARTPNVVDDDGGGDTTIIIHTPYGRRRIVVVNGRQRARQRHQQRGCAAATRVLSVPSLWTRAQCATLDPPLCRHVCVCHVNEAPLISSQVHEHALQWQYSRGPIREAQRALERTLFVIEPLAEARNQCEFKSRFITQQLAAMSDNENVQIIK